ncbi:hypothetical protein CR513_22071, partial [Mucuna pruriens]
MSHAELLPPFNHHTPNTKTLMPNANTMMTLGHITRECWGLKHKVQHLIDVGLLNFQGEWPEICSHINKSHNREEEEEEEANLTALAPNLQLLTP